MNALFYVFKNANEPAQSIPAHFDLAARIAAEQYGRGQKVYILTNTQADAELLDEYLWSFPPERFIPHNLQGEGPKAGAPVEIGTGTPVGNRTVLINLSEQVPSYIRRFSHIFDFVPFDDALKAQARARYKTLRQQGAHIETHDVT